jgi:predicted N-acyltransferase
LKVTGDREDVNSISLTVVKSLIEKYGIKLTDIGRLEVKCVFYLAVQFILKDQLTAVNAGGDGVSSRQKQIHEDGIDEFI